MNLFKRVFNRSSRLISNEIELERGSAFLHNESVAQKALMQSYRLRAREGRTGLPSFADVGFRKYSQFEEDGILLYIFSLIAPKTRKCVEICAGNGRECNTSNLIINHGWWGVLFDGDDRNVNAGNRFFRNNKDTLLLPPRFTKAWITAENVNQLLTEAGASGEVDLLSLDIDGVDYWVWKAISVIDPRVVVCEIHNPIPPELALTVPYDPGFVCPDDDYRGASLLAMTKLARTKGYRLVGVHRFGFNAFFVKVGLAEDLLPEVSVEECCKDPFTVAQQARWARVKDKEWVSV